MKTAALVFPHQLFEDDSFLKKADIVFLIEDYLYFRHYTFHAQKLVLHRASMKAYEQYLLKRGHTVVYLDSKKMSARGSWSAYIQKENIKKLLCIEVVDYWLKKDIQKFIKKSDYMLEYGTTPMFINSHTENQEFFKKQKKPFMKTFYEWQRKRLDILMDKTKPVGGKFSFDTENRKKLPKDFVQPKVYQCPQNKFVTEAQTYVADNFPNAYGSAEHFNYPIDFKSAKESFKVFLEHRLAKFGDYEDSISTQFDIVHHSTMTSYLNIGLLTPLNVVQETLAYANSSKEHIPMNSLEGFIRQIIGWREFMRAMYDIHGNTMRSSNFFNHTKKLPKTFWNAKTHNTVLDQTISRVLTSAYCHHIERLMILGNYMLLSEINPDEVHTWFMELFIDSYDWVMVPNVYGMSQFADGGIFATKPYICASNYIFKMSDYKKDGVWDTDFDTKFWDFLKKHRDFFSKNIRFKMLLSRIDKKK